MSYKEERDAAAKKYAESQLNYRPEHPGLKASCFAEGHDAALQSSVVRGLVEATENGHSLFERILKESAREMNDVTMLGMKNPFDDALEAYNKALEEAGEP